MGPRNPAPSLAGGVAFPGPDLARYGVGPAARSARAQAFDSWLAGRFPARTGIALVAVGGLGRRECSPYGDLDLILLHNGTSGTRALDELAASLWYPIWDAKLSLDHSTRTVGDSLDAAHDDVKVALGLLDARHIAGDRQLSATLSRAASELWRRIAPRQLDRLRELCGQRYAAHGCLAYLLEGDLKESEGGLRDVAVLRGIGRAGIADAYSPQVRSAATRLRNCRDALHLSAGRRCDRLDAQERGQVARLLGMPDPDTLLRRVGLDARTVSWTLADAWRGVRRWRGDLRRGRSESPVRRPVARDVVAANGELLLARTAVEPTPDPCLSLRVAAASAQTRVPIAKATLEWLARAVPQLPTPWPAAAREALLQLLGAGEGLVAAWEACDRFGLPARWLPQWTRVCGMPQHHPVHRFTLDRHLVQTAAEAAKWSRQVSRPDLLVLAAFLHDVGKGLPGDHSEVGAELAAEMATTIGMPPDDVQKIATVVRRHLLLPEVATRRDLDDAATVEGCAELIGDVATLEVLHMLARADAAATGPAAWSAWKSRLIDDLVSRVRAVLRGQLLPQPAAPDPSLLTEPLPVVGVGDDMVVLAAADRRGLLAAVAGCLAGHRLDIVTVNSTTVGERAIIECAVHDRYGVPPDRELVASDLRRVALGQMPVTRRPVRPPASGSGPSVRWAEATGAVVLELRAADSPGLLSQVTSALAEVGADVRAARISTFGCDVVDAFYLIGEVDREATEAAVLAAASP